MSAVSMDTLDSQSWIPDFSGIIYILKYPIALLPSPPPALYGEHFSL